MEGRPLPHGHAADVVTAIQKDEQCRGLFREQVCQAVEEVCGHRRASRWQGISVFVSDSIYSVTTAVLRGRTLGEEYAELLSVTSSLQQPSPLRRLTASLLSLPLDARRILGAEHWYLSLFLRLHLAAFYFFGTFRSLPDRLLGLRTLSLAEKPYRQFTYRALGGLIVLQVVFELTSRYRRRKQSRTASHSAKESSEVGRISAGLGGAEDGQQPTCQVCMCPAEVTTSTPCGHLFCWECIATWCSTKASCPLCRAASRPQELLPLQHYEVPV